MLLAVTTRIGNLANSNWKASPIRDSTSVSTPIYNLIKTRKPIYKLRIMLVGSYGLDS